MTLRRHRGARQRGARRLGLLLGLLLAVAACGGSPAPPPSAPLPTAAPTAAPTEVVLSAEPAPTPVPFDGVTVTIDAGRALHTISPLIYGVSGGEVDYMAALRPTLNSWGGNPSTRYNWRLGNAWNAGSDWFYQNTNYGTTGAVSEEFAANAVAQGQAMRLAVPTLGWVAKDTFSCSFPQADGSCGDADGANCDMPLAVADPTAANVPSTPDDIVAWLEQWLAQGYVPDLVALDNEPELWGYTHYDVHPDCTTYDEILDHYVTYARAIRPILPQSLLTGPVTCCWFFYWNSAAGRADKLMHGNEDFLPWFLDQMRAHDADAGTRHLDVLDVHYYPEGLYNDLADEATAAWRLRSTRALWDPTYVDESWIAEPVALIPTLRTVIDRHYPGTLLGISEWNWGADTTMNGALAIGDVLGIFGRENLTFAAYWQFPPPGSPGYHAFKLYTNYDDAGGRFGDVALAAESDQYDRVSAYAARDSATGALHLMLLNKDVAAAVPVRLAFDGRTPPADARSYRLEQARPDAVTAGTVTIDPADPQLQLPPYSITHIIWPAQP